MESIIVIIYKNGDKNRCINYRGISLLSTTCKNVLNILLSRIIPYSEEIIGDHQCGFDATGQLLIIYSAFVKYLRRNWNQISTGFKKAYNSVRREIFYDSLIEFGILMKLARLLKRCLKANICLTYFLLRIVLQRRRFTAIANQLSFYYAVGTVQVNQDCLKLNGAHRLLVYADDINIYWAKVLLKTQNPLYLQVRRLH